MNQQGQNLGVRPYSFSSFRAMVPFAETLMTAHRISYKGDDQRRHTTFVGCDDAGIIHSAAGASHASWVGRSLGEVLAGLEVVATSEIPAVEWERAQRTILHLQTFEQEAQFIDFLHELERSDNPVRAKAAQEIHARFIGRSLEEYEAMVIRSDESRRELEIAWGLQ